ncbi:hypothetical protein BU15DRAFT_84322, partial [Melanogaster broomeanus]
MSLEGERGRESSDNAGASPRPGAGDEEHQSAKPTKPPDATCQMASEAVTDPTNPKVRGAGPAEPVGKSYGPNDEPQENDVDEDLPRAHPPPPPIYHHPPSTNPPNVAKDVTMTLRTQDDDSSGRDERGVDGTSGQAALAKWRVEGHTRVKRAKDRIEGPEDEGLQVNRSGGKEVKNEDDEDSPSTPSIKSPSSSTSK